jgi:tRNA G37 N-methylase Trm5
MPLTTSNGDSLVVLSSTETAPNVHGFAASWLAELINERHERNGAKIERFVKAVREMPLVQDDRVVNLYTLPPTSDDLETNDNAGVRLPRSYDVIGDVALIHSLPTEDPVEQREIGESIMRKNKSIKIVALRQSNLGGTERAPGVAGIQILAGCTTRNPLLTTHREYNISCVVDLHHTFFSPRMGPERLRICQQTARGEHVLVLFSGVGMDALQIAGRTEAATVTAVELNSVAVECARKAHKLLERNKQGVKCPGAAERLQIIQGDCLQVIPTLPRNHYHRILAPRPKEGNVDGDQPSDRLEDGTRGISGGADFLSALLSVLQQNGGECHWYDFCADHEFPQCERTRAFLQGICSDHGLGMQVLHVANVGSVAKRQVSSAYPSFYSTLQTANYGLY